MEKLPSKTKLFRKGFLFGLNNIWRNKVLSLATIFVIGIIIFIFNIILAVNFIATDALSDLSKKIDVIVYLKDSTTYSQVQNMSEDIQELKGIENITYTSKEKALKQLQKTHPNLAIAFEKYKLGNPLPASLNIVTSNPEYHQDIDQLLNQPRYQALLSNVITSSKENNEVITSVSKNLVAVNIFTNQIIFWLVTIFIIGGALIILNALQITIFTRRKEIEVMKLVGASYFSIRLPFIIESIIYGIAAVLLSFLMLLVVSQKISIQGSNLFSYLSNIEFLYIFLAELFVTILLGVLSSIVAVHEHLFRKSI